MNNSMDRKSCRLKEQKNPVIIKDESDKFSKQESQTVEK